MTAGSRRRARERRHLAYRDFGDAHGWTVVGLADDLAVRYPVPSLTGTASAQAEIALAGTAYGREGLVASVLVLPEDGPERVVQLTVLGGVPDEVPPVDGLAVVGRDLVHTRELAGRAAVDVEGPLRLLGDLLGPA